MTPQNLRFLRQILIETKLHTELILQHSMLRHLCYPTLLLAIVPQSEARKKFCPKPWDLHLSPSAREHSSYRLSDFRLK